MQLRNKHTAEVGGIKPGATVTVEDARAERLLSTPAGKRYLAQVVVGRDHGANPIPVPPEASLAEIPVPPEAPPAEPVKRVRRHAPE